MQTKALIQKIVERLNRINTIIPELNSGGCGVFAHAMALELQNKGLKPKVAVIANPWVEKLDDDFPTKVKQEEGRITARNLNDKGGDLAHLMVYIEEEGLYIDSEGVYTDIKDSNWSRYKHQFNLTVEEAGEIAETSEGWNPEFHRGFVPKVYDMVFNAVNKTITKFQPQPIQLSFNF